MLSLLGWIGDVLLVWGVWQIGNKRRIAYLITVGGELCWIIKSLVLGQYDLAVICVIFTVLALRCWFKWGN